MSSQTETRTSHSVRYLPALDGLRFVSAAVVVVFHCFVDAAIIRDNSRPLLGGLVKQMGSTAVEVFFSLSGFVITRVLLEERKQRGKIDLFAFYIRRTLRIWPAYYLALALAYGGMAILGDRYARPLGSAVSPDTFRLALPAHLLFLGNWVEHTPNTLVPLWSVCIEEQFYLLFPLTLLLSRRRAPVVVPAVTGLLLAYALRFRQGNSVNVFAHDDALLMGALLAQVFFLYPEPTIAFFKRWGLAGELLAIVGLLAHTEWSKTSLTAPWQWVVFYAISSVVTAFTVGMFGLGGGPLSQVLARPISRFLGALTYTTYVFHVYAILVAWVLVKHLGTFGPWSAATLRATLAVPMAVGIAYLCRITFEQRCLRLKDRFTRTVMSGR